jgi:hypothetical protein
MTYSVAELLLLERCVLFFHKGFAPLTELVAVPLRFEVVHLWFRRRLLRPSFSQRVPASFYKDLHAS